MQKPHNFAGRVIQKNGKTILNDYPAEEKFFRDAEDFYRALDNIPFKAVEDLRKYDLNREVLVNIVTRIFTILGAAEVNVVDEMQKLQASPFDGLEEDLKLKEAGSKMEDEQHEPIMQS